MKKSGTTTVSVAVKNTGTRGGDEVVQMYVQHQGSTILRPRRELKGFRRIHLEPGGALTVNFELAADTLATWNAPTKRFDVETDTVKVMVGSSSADVKLSLSLPVVE